MEQLTEIKRTTPQLMREFGVGPRIIMRLRALCSDNATLAECSSCVGLSETVCEIVIQHFSMRAVMKENPTQAELDLAANRRRERIAIWQETIAAKAGDAALNGFDLATQSASFGDSKGFADAARGVSAFTQLARQAEGLDSDAKPGSGGSISLAVFVVRPGEQPIEVSATPVAELRADASEPDFD